LMKSNIWMTLVPLTYKCALRPLGTVIKSAPASPRATAPFKVVAPEAVRVVNAAAAAAAPPIAVPSMVPPLMSTKSNI
jgi:hypothetical protein